MFLPLVLFDIAQVCVGLRESRFAFFMRESVVTVCSREIPQIFACQGLSRFEIQLVVLVEVRASLLERLSENPVWSGEYDIWAMKMEHYLAHTDYPIWEVIQNGNGPVSITTDTSGQIKVLPPRTAEEIVARERERKARTTLLMALPEDHLAKFHKMT
ncbi:hypothetical protein Tco_0282193, partial [Tanacetum coccineum]